MSDADETRQRATRLFALAIKAREDGKSNLADELTKLASEGIGRANPLDDQIRPTPSEAPGPDKKQ